MKVIGNVELENVKKLRSGKVREMFAFNDKILIVTTDRISAFDFILKSLIPLKGAILNKISNFWFDYLKSVIKNHLIEVDVNNFPKILKKQKNVLKHRSVIVKRARVIPIECVVRGYLAGSGWNEYKESGKIEDIKLPPNLKMCEKLPEAIFTPTTKEDIGHDIGITIKKAKKIFGSKLIDYIKEKSIELYLKASEYALGKGIIIADTKFEFGMIGDEVILIDEVLTPDSSRFWPLKDYESGRDQNSFDKQYVRNYLLSTDWDRTSTPPKLPPDVIEKTTQRYASAYENLVGRKFDFK
jgi:phosphoribosylaminoimidazole-succinocarboxamide synthase